MPTLTQPTLDQLAVNTLRGVGPAMADKLAKLAIHTVQDVLFHLPLRYQDRTKVTPIGALQAGSDALIEVEVKLADVVFGKRRSLACRVQDGSGTVTLRFYHFSAAQKNQLSPGTRLRCYGEVRRGTSGFEFYHPEYKIISDKQPPPHAATLTPVYPSSEGLSQLSWRKLSEQALALLQQHQPQELLPRQHNRGVDLAQALQYLHRPPSNADQAALQAGLHPFQQRLAFEELVAHHLSLNKQRQQIRQLGAPALAQAPALSQQFLQQLPFALTAAQQRVAEQISLDLCQQQPMLRLVQGDVGSGKTVVAALAALQAIASGYQVAMMAPTEILAEQHLSNFSDWLSPLGINIAWLSGKLKGKQRQAQLNAIADGSAQMVVGTHALFQEQVVFAQLGLAIIDEQHRFGVHQRLALKEKSQLGHPHQLIMTATPIPRTLAMSAYADLDTSVIDELPPGRTPVNTVVIDNSRRDELVARVAHACQEGRQVYWVCTLIEESEALEAQAAEHTAELLKAALPQVRVGLVHGRMKAAEKAEAMRAYKAHQIDLLVATTVIEVGVDVPNASLMIIENAERLGLAQLHQLRGRVGRGSTASHCLLMYQAPLSKLGKERLQAMRDSSDGFVIAEKDLQLRGPGELLGTRQTGLLQMRIADLQRDGHLLAAVKQCAEQLISQQPATLEPLIARWLAGGEQYAQV
ncbi:ATP-dependent DNA helicase RecG [Dasania sp. GY-MA-18]|uniref:ATP-dependent DNA helicase RecG n=1 Tax=Dasania phycosphaerae TaxID=2950436 RepID=A0A9J6RPW9_9GAMM|nr:MULTISPECIES: ATP-dependent DNA helicase RecG [Dasania]MCR8923782.1 ATP-dependent DNA helicase RecG [Dasania sp. GY-MA-18]MCZ0866216.1 ATP-dependent DNA helicase RecG [Dasania phycosphaerae]MCZ0869940.1 ATP-dependent DNA helicase RecG [Dasania phycosphaerae]